MAKEFIIKTKEDWQNVLNLVAPVVAVKPFRIQLFRGLKRTLDQNKLFHAVCEECAKRTGLKDAKFWKDELKLKIGLKEVHIDLDDQPHVIVVSTTKYSTKQMADFCEKIVAYMKTEYEVDIELPNELTKRSK